MIWIVEFETENVKGTYTVSCSRKSDARQYTAEDIAEQIGTDPERVTITSVERSAEK